MATQNSSNDISIDPWMADQSAKSREVLCPPDKSLTHRALMFAALAPGQSVIAHPLLGEDCIATARAFQAMGVQVELVEDSTGYEQRMVVTSPGQKGWRSPAQALDCANSGTSARLLLGLLASTPGLQATLSGDASLSRRPMARVVEPLKRMGAKFTAGGDTLPISVLGSALTAAALESNVASAQVKSAILLAALNTAGATSIRMPRGGRDHTEKLLRKLGCAIRTKIDDTHETITVTGPFVPAAQSWRVPGDPSSAAFLIALGLLHPGSLRVRRMLDNPTRVGFLEVLKRMGATFERLPSGGGDGPKMLPAMEPEVDVVVRGGNTLKAVNVLAKEVPTLIDEVPILATLAARAEGTSAFHGLAELRVKESDRLTKTAELVALAGGIAEIQGDSLLVQGRKRPLKPFVFDPVGDHRLAMAAAVIGTIAEASSVVQGGECVAVSFPGFFATLAAVR